MVKIALIMIGFGGFLLWEGLKEVRLWAAADTEPQTLTCAELGNDGPGDNAHVVMTDFAMAKEFVVEQWVENQKERPSLRLDRWSTVWVGARPLYSSSEDAIKSFKVILKLNAISGESELMEYAMRDSLQGMVINRIESLDEEARNLLIGAFPRVELDRCVILEVGRKPAGVDGMLLPIGGGGVLMAAGVGVIVLRSRPSRNARDASKALNTLATPATPATPATKQRSDKDSDDSPAVSDLSGDRATSIVASAPAGPSTVASAPGLLADVRRSLMLLGKVLLAVIVCGVLYFYHKRSSSARSPGVDPMSEVDRSFNDLMRDLDQMEEDLGRMPPSIDRMHEAMRRGSFKELDELARSLGLNQGLTFQNNLGLFEPLLERAWEQDQVAMAMALAGEILRIKPEHARALEILARGHAAMGSWPEAIAHSQQLVRLHPNE